MQFRKTRVPRLSARLTAALLALALPISLPITLPVSLAAQTQFQDIAEIEVLDGGWTERGTYQAALRLTLAEGWKTYWRSPGEAGIPPRFSWRGSRHVDAVQFVWPTPSVFDTAGLRTLGYHDELVLPVEITPDRPGAALRLRGQVELGLCREVCIPSTLRFDHKPDPKAGRNPTIAAALAARPYSAQEAGVRKTTCRLRPSPYGLTVEARITMPSAGGTEVAVIESGRTDVVAGETKSRRDAGQLIAETELFALEDTPLAIDRSALRITVLGGAHAVDIRGCDAG